MPKLGYYLGMSTQIEDLEEEVEVSEALRARFAFATGNVKPISDEQLGKSRVKRTARLALLWMKR